MTRNRTFVTAIAIALTTLYTSSLQAQEMDSPSRDEERTQVVTIAQGNHATIAFWPNRHWSSRSIQGELKTGSGEALAGVEVSLVRFDFLDHHFDERQLPTMDLEELEANFGTVFEKLSPQPDRLKTDESGKFNFSSLPPGYYSLRLDWPHLGSAPYVVAHLTYPPEKGRARRPIYVPVVTGGMDSEPSN